MAYLLWIILGFGALLVIDYLNEWVVLSELDKEDNWPIVMYMVLFVLFWPFGVTRALYKHWKGAKN